MRAVLVIQAVVSAALASGCTSSPTGPSGAGQSSTRLAVAPSSATIGAGLLLRLHATAGGEAVLSSGVSWRSLNDAVATVDGGGLVQGIEPGQTQIVARWGDGRATALITVVTPTRAGPSCPELALGGSATSGDKKAACQ